MPNDEKEPWLKFWVKSWRADSALRSCSWGAKGVWIDMLCIIHEEGQPYGHLSLLEGQPMTEAKLISKMGGNAPELRRLIRELEDNKVFSRTAAGVIFSRKMVRDQKKRLLLKQNAAAGGRASWSSKCSSKLLKQSVEQDSTSNLSPLTSDPDPAKKNAGGDDNEAVIPTAQEVIDFGRGPAGIDPEFCAYYHAVCTEKQRWVGALGRELLWRLEIVRWWSERRESWYAKKTGREKNAGRDEILAELQWCTDPERIKSLRKTLEESA